jgi:hypothetical protein
MITTTLRQGTTRGQRPPTFQDELLTEVRAIRSQQEKLTRLLSEFAGSFLNARFPYGKPADRWPRR